MLQTNGYTTLAFLVWVVVQGTGERRLDVVEFIAVVRALGADPAEVLKKIEAACRP